jgi:hypothetical protein
MPATSFVAVYRGATIATARLVAVSSEPALVAEVAARLLQELAVEEPDPIAAKLEGGRRSALRLIAREAGDGPDH